MAKPHSAHLRPARRSQTVAASTAVTLTEATAGVHAQASGNMVGTLAGDTSARTFVVVQGAFYPYAFMSFDATNAVACIALFNV